MDRRTRETTAGAPSADPDVDCGESGPVRPVHLRAKYVALVFCGGTLGTLARYGLEVVLPAPDGLPLPTLLINLSGAFLLGVLLEALLRRGPETGRLRVVRLSAGTGFLGAFTTYSTFALESVQLGAAQHYVAMALYLVLSLVGGVLASAAGMWVAAAHHRRTRPGRENP